MNKAIAGKADLESKTVEQLISNLDAVPADISGPVRNNGGGHAEPFRHLFWKWMGPKAGSAPAGLLADDDIKAAFGTFDAFGKRPRPGAGRFGSGWVWLVVNGGKLSPLPAGRYHGQGGGVAEHKVTVLGCDVCRTSAYLKYCSTTRNWPRKAFWDCPSSKTGVSGEVPMTRQKK